jgi:[ribosomal protein S5]-alanine N-acetyltransferase
MPSLQTDRLLLRPYTDHDLNDLHRILADPVTMRFWPAPFTLQATRSWLERSQRSHTEHGFGRMAMILKNQQTLIGDCGITHAEIDGSLENDLGYILFYPYWRQGLATEAAMALMHHAFATLGLDRLVANMPVEHVASRRVAERLGMRLEKQFRNHRNRGIITCLYATENPYQSDHGA